jgi:undecaprenyl phosphate-alpha-L-ara4N flippase subunit ArnE
MLALRSIPLSVAYPTVAASYIVVLVASHLLFGEPLTVTSIAGVACIGLGIYLVHHA